MNAWLTKHWFELAGMVIAVYAAGLSTFTAARQWSRERRCVRLRVSLVDMFQMGNDMKPITALNVDVLNAGREPVTITHFGWYRPKKARAVFFPNVGPPLEPPYSMAPFPWALAPHERRNYVVPIEACPADCLGHFVIDTLDRSWRVKSKDHKALQAKLAKHRKSV
jgi:hypothetical protein